MNAQDVRKALLADPGRVSPEMEHAIAQDPDLAKFRQQLLTTDGKLAAAFGEVVPSPGLSDRIILRVRFQRRSTWMAGVAALCLFAALMFVLPKPDSPPPIATAMLNHVVENLDELADNGNVPAATVETSLGRIGVTFHDAGYRIRHLAECVVEGRVGRHLVMSSPDGLVSFLIVPMKDGELRTRQNLDKGNFQAMLVPARQVVIGVFAEKSVATKRMDNMIRTLFPGSARSV